MLTKTRHELSSAIPYFKNVTKMENDHIEF